MHCHTVASPPPLPLLLDYLLHLQLSREMSLSLLGQAGPAGPVLGAPLDLLDPLDLRVGLSVPLGLMDQKGQQVGHIVNPVWNEIYALSLPGSACGSPGVVLLALCSG
jgi:hypothetical protein